jgi:hypothetical protein
VEIVPQMEDERPGIGAFPAFCEIRNPPRARVGARQARVEQVADARRVRVGLVARVEALRVAVEGDDERAGRRVGRVAAASGGEERGQKQRRDEGYGRFMFDSLRIALVRSSRRGASSFGETAEGSEGVGCAQGIPF